VRWIKLALRQLLSARKYVVSYGIVLMSLYLVLFPRNGKLFVENHVYPTRRTSWGWPHWNLA